MRECHVRVNKQFVLPIVLRQDQYRSDKAKESGQMVQRWIGDESEIGLLVVVFITHSISTTSVDTLSSLV